MTHSASTPPAVLVVGDPAGDIAPAIADELVWQGYRAELRAPEDDFASDAELANWEFMILDLAVAETIPLRPLAERPYRILLVPPDHPDDTIRALTDLGACAVLESPPHPGVLAATLLNLCRRFCALLPERPQHTPVRAGDETRDWRLQTTSWALVAPDGKAISLTRAEMSFLRALAESPGEAVARSRLIADMGHNVEYYDARRLDTFVSRLRHKVAAASGEPLPLRSIHAYGYAFAAPIVVD